MVGSQEVLLLGAQAGSLLLVLLVARAARRAHAVAPAPALRRFGLGFLLLGLSHVGAFALEALRVRTTSLPTTGVDAFDVAFWTYYLAGLLGYGFVFASFGRHPFQWAGALVGVLQFAGVTLETLTILVLFFLVLHAGLNHIRRARPGSLHTALGFFFLLLGHFLFYLNYFPLSPRNALGEVPTLAGYLLLYLAITRPRWSG